MEAHVQRVLVRPAPIDKGHDERLVDRLAPRNGPDLLGSVLNGYAVRRPALVE